MPTPLLATQTNPLQPRAVTPDPAAGAVGEAWTVGGFELALRRLLAPEPQAADRAREPLAGEPADAAGARAAPDPSVVRLVPAPGLDAETAPGLAVVASGASTGQRSTAWTVADPAPPPDARPAATGTAPLPATVAPGDVSGRAAPSVPKACSPPGTAPLSPPPATAVAARNETRAPDDLRRRPSQTDTPAKLADPPPATADAAPVAGAASAPPAGGVAYPAAAAGGLGDSLRPATAIARDGATRPAPRSRGPAAAPGGGARPESGGKTAAPSGPISDVASPSPAPAPADAAMALVVPGQIPVIAPAIPGPVAKDAPATIAPAANPDAAQSQRGAGPVAAAPCPGRDAPVPSPDGPGRVQAPPSRVEPPHNDGLAHPLEVGRTLPDARPGAEPTTAPSGDADATPAPVSAPAPGPSALPVTSAEAAPAGLRHLGRAAAPQLAAVAAPDLPAHTPDRSPDRADAPAPMGMPSGHDRQTTETRPARAFAGPMQATRPRTSSEPIQAAAVAVEQARSPTEAAPPSANPTQTQLQAIDSTAALRPKATRPEATAASGPAQRRPIDAPTKAADAAVSLVATVAPSAHAQQDPAVAVPPLDRPVAPAELAIAASLPDAPAQARPAADAAPAASATASAPADMSGAGLAPARQLAPALAIATAQAPRSVTIHLDPVELGRLRIRVERSNDGPASVTLTADRPETLLLLVRDQAELHRALDHAGVAAEGRTIRFHLASDEGAAASAIAGAQTAPSTPSPPADSGPASGHGPAAQDAGRANDEAGRQNRGHTGDGARPRAAAWAGSGTASDDPAPPLRRPATGHASIDITA